MSSVCISNSINDARDTRVPVRATYVNLYKWPESDAEFVRSVSSRETATSSSSRAASSGRFSHPRVVDSISCRQMYLRSYKFSREETLPQNKTHKCFGRVLFQKNEHVSDDDYSGETRKKKKKKKKKKNKSNNKCLFLERVKDFSYAVFRRCLSCTTTVDVVVADPHNK